jgi:surface antigen
MQKIFIKASAAILLACGLAGCASESNYSEMPREQGRSMAEAPIQKPLQCVPYARDHSQVKIFGDAYTWWDKAAGKYPRGTLPEVGAVMVLNNYAGSQRGHVAVVRTLISSREIRIDHANWLDDGSIYVNNPVVDVSDGNDWSRVRVWNIKTGGWGSKVYPVQGFIGSHEDSAPQDDRRAGPDLLAQADHTLTAADYEITEPSQ